MSATTGGGAEPLGRRDPRENVSGHVMGPGRLARSANGHLLRRAVEHGAWDPRLDRLELPSNISVMRAKRL